MDQNRIAWRKIIRDLIILAGVLVGVPFVLCTGVGAAIKILTRPQQSTGETWNNITVGVTTAEQVVAEMGPPDEVDGDKWSFYRDDDRFDPDCILFSRKGVVTEVWDEISRQEAFEDYVYLPEFIEQYGNPDYVTWGYVNSRVVVFLDDGVMVTVSPDPQPEDSYVITAYYFRPCSLTCIRVKYWGEFSSGPWYTECELPPELKLEDPWGLTTNGS